MRAWTTSSSVTPRARAVVGAPIARRASRTSCQFPPWRYIIMSVPAPHCSPWRAGFRATRSSAWENLCSLPDAGREDPAIDIATPEDTRALHTNQALSSSRGLMLGAFSITRRAASSLRAAAYDEYGSFRRFRARAQSFTAVRFEMMSPQPAARRRNGDSAMIPVSMITEMGVWAAKLTFSPFFMMDARDETTPSWLAAVGTLRNGTPALNDAHFATSMERPPPTPRAKSISPLRIRSSAPRTSSQVASGMRYVWALTFLVPSWVSTVFPAIFIVVSSATIRARRPSLRLWQTSPTCRRASCPTTTFRGSSIVFDFEKDSTSMVDTGRLGPRPRGCFYLALSGDASRREPTLSEMTPTAEPLCRPLEMERAHGPPRLRRRRGRQRSREGRGGVPRGERPLRRAPS